MKQRIFLTYLMSSLIISCLQAIAIRNKKISENTKIPVIVVSDLYYPPQDPGDNFDLITGFALPEIDLLAVILDITDDFRKDSVFAFNLFNVVGGPREPGIIPVTQLNYIFDKTVPYAIGPMSPMRFENDQMKDIPMFQQEGVNLLLKTLKSSKHPIDILSFGSARAIAVAYNRNPNLFKKKVRMIHISAGNSSFSEVDTTSNIWEKIPGGEWNVALDVHAFTRLLRSDLPLSLYPCAGKKGVFSTDEYNTYWRLDNLDFIQRMDSKLRCYLDDVFSPKLSYDFLRRMDRDEKFSSKKSPHHVWETAVWINVSQRILVQDEKQSYKIIPKQLLDKTDRIIDYQMLPCKLSVFDDGNFNFTITSGKTNTFIYHRTNPDENEKALQQALPNLYISFKTHNQ